MNTRGLPVDEWYGIAATGLCKAALIYNSEKGKFSTIAYACINNEINMEFRNKNKLAPEISLDEYFIENDNILIAQNKADDLLNYNELLNYIQNNMSPRQKKIISYLLQGMSQTNIARALSVSKTTVSNDIGKIKKKILRYYKE